MASLPGPDKICFYISIYIVSLRGSVTTQVAHILLLLTSDRSEACLFICNIAHCTCLHNARCSALYGFEEFLFLLVVRETDSLKGKNTTSVD